MWPWVEIWRGTKKLVVELRNELHLQKQQPKPKQPSVPSEVPGEVPLNFVTSRSAHSLRLRLRRCSRDISVALTFGDLWRCFSTCKELRLVCYTVHWCIATIAPASLLSSALRHGAISLHWLNKPSLMEEKSSASASVYFTLAFWWIELRREEMWGRQHFAELQHHYFLFVSPTYILTVCSALASGISGTFLPSGFWPGFLLANQIESPPKGRWKFGHLGMPISCDSTLSIQRRALRTLKNCGNRKFLSIDVYGTCTDFCPL